MRLLKLSCALLFLTTLAAVGPAFADSNPVSMNFLSVGGNNGGGVYTYPYNFSVNGGPSTPLICDTFDNEVAPGETWKANTSSLMSDAGLFQSKSNSQLDYEAAGLIFQGIVSGKINPTVGNWAIWALFSQNAYNNSYFTSSGANLIYNQYLGIAAGDSQSQLTSLLGDIVVYTPIAGSQSTGFGTPQEYFGIQVPEAGSTAMLGIAFLAIAGGVWKKYQIAPGSQS